MVSKTTLPAVLITLTVPLLLLTSCGLLGMEESPDTVQLRVDEDDYDPGDSVTLILENGSDHRIGYNLCTSSLERQQEDSWATVRSYADQVCTLELRTLPPGERATYDTEIPSKIRDGEPLPDGSYRYVANIDNMDDNTRTSVTTQPFTVD